METVSLPIFLKWLQSYEFPHKLGICERLFNKRFAAKQVCWVETAAGIPWKLDLRNPTHRWIVYGQYEGKFFLEWAKNFLGADAIVVDSGANIGQIILYLAQWIPKGKFIAFEPCQSSADWIEECLKVNPELPVELLRFALGNKAHNVRLFNPSPTHIHGAQNYISQEEGEEIQVVRLEDFLGEKGISRVDLWKLDVEGYEIPALQGAEIMLRQKRIKALYVEMHGKNGQNIRDYLKKLDYSCYLFNSKGMPYRPGNFKDCCNGLFLPN